MTKKLNIGRSQMKRSTAALGIAGLALAGITGPAFADGEEEKTVSLVGVNDFHGRIDAGLSIEDGEVVSEGAAVRLAAAVEEARAENPNTLFVGAGDLYSASTFTSMAGNDIPTTDVFNAMKMDTSSVGNHEFDNGFDDLQDRINGSGAYSSEGKIDWTYLGANVYDESGEAALPEYLIEDVDGLDIAFIGLVTQETPSLVTPSGIEGLEFGDPADAVERVINQNQEVQDADTIVVLTHDGGVNGDAVKDTNTHFGQFAQAMADRADIAGIFSGHTHTLYEVDLDVPTTEATVGNMPVIQTGSFGENMGSIELTFEIDDDGEATLVTSESDMTPLSEVSVPDVGDNDVVDDVRDIVDEAVELATEVGEEVIGEAGADLLRATHVDPETGNPGENRGGASTISDLIADAQLWAVHDQDAADTLPEIAFMNPGGVRTDIDKGEVTYKEVADVQPFANTLETLDLTGAQIKDVLEEQWQPDGSSRPFLKLGISDGFIYTYDPEADRGERVTSMTLHGDDIDLDASYRVVTNNFLASGGDNFFTLGEGSDYSDTGLVDLQAFVDYFEDNDVVYPDYFKRALGLNWVSDADAVYGPGDEVEIQLSALAFSNGEPTADTVSVSVTDSDGSQVGLGEFEVDDTVVNTNDETGQALLEFQIPDDLDLTEDPTEMPITVTTEFGVYEVATAIQLAGDSDDVDGSDEDGTDGDDADGDGDGDGTDGDDDEGLDPLPDGDGDDADGSQDPDDDLSETGVNMFGVVAISALLLAVGVGVVTARRRALN